MDERMDEWDPDVLRAYAAARRAEQCNLAAARYLKAVRRKMTARGDGRMTAEEMARWAILERAAKSAQQIADREERRIRRKYPDAAKAADALMEQSEAE